MKMPPNRSRAAPIRKAPGAWRLSPPERMPITAEDVASTMRLRMPLGPPAKGASVVEQAPAPMELFGPSVSLKYEEGSADIAMREAL